MKTFATLAVFGITAALRLQEEEEIREPFPNEHMCTLINALDTTSEGWFAAIDWSQAPQYGEGASEADVLWAKWFCNDDEAKGCRTAEKPMQCMESRGAQWCADNGNEGPFCDPCAGSTDMDACYAGNDPCKDEPDDKKLECWAGQNCQNEPEDKKAECIAAELALWADPCEGVADEGKDQCYAQDACKEATDKEKCIAEKIDEMNPCADKVTDDENNQCWAEVNCQNEPDDKKADCIAAQLGSIVDHAPWVDPCEGEDDQDKLDQCYAELECQEATDKEACKAEKIAAWYPCKGKVGNDEVNQCWAEFDCKDNADKEKCVGDLLAQWTCEGEGCGEGEGEGEVTTD